MPHNSPHFYVNFCAYCMASTTSLKNMNTLKYKQYFPENLKVRVLFKFLQREKKGN